jgi:hypothetical protein
MKQPPLQAVSETAPPTTAPSEDPFAPENLRLDQDYAETAGVYKVITTIPVKRPGKQIFFRVRPGEEWRATFPIIDLKDEGEEYIVTRAMQAELSTESVLKQLRLGVTRQGNLFFLPLRLPGPDGRDMEWWSSLRDHADRAETSWLRVVPNRELGAYEALVARDALVDPNWDELTQGLSYWDLIKIAFKKYLIDSVDHPVVKRLRGHAI